MMNERPEGFKEKHCPVDGSPCEGQGTMEDCDACRQNDKLNNCSDRKQWPKGEQPSDTSFAKDELVGFKAKDLLNAPGMFVGGQVAPFSRVRLTADSPIVWNLQRGLEHVNAAGRMAAEAGDPEAVEVINAASVKLKREIKRLLWE